MNIPVRWIVTAAILFFSFGGQSYLFQKLSTDVPQKITVPDGGKELVSDIQPLLSKITPGDRAYLRDLYLAVGTVLERDAMNAEPVISTTGKFREMHQKTLELAIDRKDIGRVPGLGQAIDKTFERAAGLEESRVDDEKRAQLIAGCTALAWAFQINKDE